LCRSTLERTARPRGAQAAMGRSTQTEPRLGGALCSPEHTLIVATYTDNRRAAGSGRRSLPSESKRARHHLGAGLVALWVQFAVLAGGGTNGPIRRRSTLAAAS